jgi:hypothetical protein
MIFPFLSFLPCRFFLLVFLFIYISFLTLSFLFHFFFSFILFLISLLFLLSFYLFIFTFYFIFFVLVSIFVFFPFSIFSPPLIFLLFEMRCKFVLARLIRCSGYKYIVRAIITTCSDPCSDLF